MYLLDGETEVCIGDRFHTTLQGDLYLAKCFGFLSLINGHCTTAYKSFNGCTYFNVHEGTMDVRLKPAYVQSRRSGGEESYLSCTG